MEDINKAEYEEVFQGRVWKEFTDFLNSAKEISLNSVVDEKDPVSIYRLQGGLIALSTVLAYEAMRINQIKEKTGEG